MVQALKTLLNGDPAEIPDYSFVECRRLETSSVVAPSTILIFEGILSLHEKEIRDMLDLKIFIDCELDIALARRIERDIQERGRDIQEVLGRYNRFVRKDYKEFILPAMKIADLIIPGSGSNDISLNLLLELLSSKFNSSPNSSLRFPWKTMIRAQELNSKKELPKNIAFLPQETFSSTIRLLQSPEEIIRKGALKTLTKGLGLLCLKDSFLQSSKPAVALINEENIDDSSNPLVLISHSFGLPEQEKLARLAKKDRKIAVISLNGDTSTIESLSSLSDNLKFYIGEQIEDISDCKACSFLFSKEVDEVKIDKIMEKVLVRLFRKAD